MGFWKEIRKCTCEYCPSVDTMSGMCAGMLAGLGLQIMIMKNSRVVCGGELSYSWCAGLYYSACLLLSPGGALVGALTGYWRNRALTNERNGGYLLLNRAVDEEASAETSDVTPNAPPKENATNETTRMLIV